GRPSESRQPGPRRARALGGLVPRGDVRGRGAPGPLPSPFPAEGQEMDAGTELGAQSIWPSIYPELLRLVQPPRSTIVFVNNRRLAERLALRLNEAANEGNDGPRHQIARAHPGSPPRGQPRPVEDDL